MSQEAGAGALTLTKKDFVSDQQVKWCPGCGDYSVLSSIQSVMPELGIPKEKIVFISGIGCSSRFPHYMNTYGFHTIHGRAPAVATGLKLTNPDLSVWVITGDGDALSIGGNHLLHAIRRNIGLKIVLFNNSIYGLTKGQASPTSKKGLKTKSTPFGLLDPSFNPVCFAVSSGGTFVARTTDKDPKHMQEVLLKAAKHKGTAFIEVLQNCVMFNDKVHAEITSPETKDNNQLKLENGKPMIFGPEGDKKGLRFNPKTFEMEVVKLGENGITESDLLVHKEDSHDVAVQISLANLTLPAALGVIRAVEWEAPYEEEVYGQMRAVTEQKGKGDLEKLLLSGNTWTVS